MFVPLKAGRRFEEQGGNALCWEGELDRGSCSVTQCVPRGRQLGCGDWAVEKVDPGLVLLVVLPYEGQTSIPLAVPELPQTSITTVLTGTSVLQASAYGGQSSIPEEI